MLENINANELESVLKELTRDSSRFAIFYDEKKGWCMTDQIDLPTSEKEASFPKYQATCFNEWFKGSLSEAVNFFSIIKFSRAQQIQKSNM